MNMMFRLFLVACAWVHIGLVSWSQPILVQPAQSPLGFSADIVSGNPIEPTLGGDEAQNWDFSDVAGTTVGLQQVSPAASNPFLPLFDGAEWVSAVGDQLSFWMWDEGEMVVLGNANAAAGITIPFDDPLVQWSFPLSYGDSGEDTFGTGLMLFGQPYSLEGDAAYAMDAWGSITLPGGMTVDPVLRGRYDQFYMETYDGDTAYWYLDQTVYLAQDSVLPLLLHENLLVTDASGNALIEFSDVAWFDNHVLSTGEVEVAVGLPHPNPAARGEVLNWSLPSGWGWKAMTMDGRVLEQGVAPASGLIRMETLGWKSGLVLLVPLQPGHGGAGRIHKVLVR